MRDLLERWARLEPERCDPQGFVTLDGLPLGGLSHPGAVLAATIEAIEAQGMRWSVAFLPDESYQGIVTIPAGPAVTDYRRGSAGDTPAEALLTAYLAALGVFRDSR